jgi:hypothetical protein
MIHTPKITYLVSSPFGDLAVDESKWHLPLDGDPCKTPYSTYFHSIRDFILQNELNPVIEPAQRKLNRKVDSQELVEMVIRSEKHGALYHPASIEIFLENARLKLCLNVAVSEEGKQWLRNELSVLDLLHDRYHLPYLPRPYYHGEFNAMFFLVEDWFEGYHEFHLSIDEQERQRVKLWDFDKGFKYLTKKQSFELYFLISRLLTMYYDFESASQIYPWHHAAGDFIARVGYPNISHCDQEIDVRLVTARGYQPRIILNDKEPSCTLTGLYFFFLSMVIRMRLDRLDGVGRIVWADDVCLDAAVKGFFDALRSRLDVNISMDILKFFSQGQLRTDCDQILESYAGTEESTVLQSNIDTHVKRLHATLKKFSLSPKECFTAC